MKHNNGLREDTIKRQTSNRRVSGAVRVMLAAALALLISTLATTTHA